MNESTASILARDLEREEQYLMWLTSKISNVKLELEEYEGYKEKTNLRIAEIQKQLTP